jgi:hypothetical protein
MFMVELPSANPERWDLRLSRFAVEPITGIPSFPAIHPEAALAQRQQSAAAMSQRLSIWHPLTVPNHPQLEKTGHEQDRHLYSTMTAAIQPRERTALAADDGQGRGADLSQSSRLPLRATRGAKNKHHHRSKPPASGIQVATSAKSRHRLSKRAGRDRWSPRSRCPGLTAFGSSPFHREIGALSESFTFGQASLTK